MINQRRKFTATQIKSADVLQFKEIYRDLFPRVLWHLSFFPLPAEDQVVVSSDYDSTHEGNHSECSDVAHTEEDTEEGKPSAQNVMLHPLIPPEVQRVSDTLWQLTVKE